ncbi:unnamed protein product [Miscanthus lutarioriparius]|uniref:BHLH domain-containing protein n=1 Tax=Miscanthus lutarioriparius TaxID=422564 RepID=A0A811RBW1_9POAL|nr:unnamed protein product [Miscanthus lutarioriparius]
MRWSRKDRDGPLPPPCRLRLAETGATGSLLIHGGIPSSCGGVAVGGTGVSSFAAKSLNYICPRITSPLKLCPRLVRSKQSELSRNLVIGKLVSHVLFAVLIIFVHWSMGGVAPVKPLAKVDNLTTHSLYSDLANRCMSVRAFPGAAALKMIQLRRRERINERLSTLQQLIPNGTKVDMSTMLEEAVQYVKFLQLQIKLLLASMSKKFF